MIVCSCNAIREDEIRAAARRGCACPESAYAALGCEPQCRNCLCYAQEIIDEEHRGSAGGGARSAFDDKVVPIRAQAA